MPIYEYRCDKGHTFEVLQRMADDPFSACTACGAPVQRVFHPVAVHFKGSGFYTTDYRTKKDKDARDAASSDSKPSDKKGSDSKSSDSKSSEPKSSESKSSESKSKASASSSHSS